MSLFPAGALYHWKLNDDSGANTVINYGREVASMTCTNVGLGTPGKVQSSAYFSTTSYITASGTALNFNGKNAITLASWIYLAGTTSCEVINNGGYGNSYVLEVEYSRVRFVKNSAWGVTDHYAGYITSTTWQHIASTYDGTNAITYINGVQSSMTTWANGFSVTSYTVNIGTRNSGYTTQARLEDVRIYDRALSATEIAAIYNSGAGTYCDIQPSGTTYWAGETLYQYDASTYTWDPKYDLTPTHHWKLNDSVITGSSIIINSTFETDVSGWTANSGTGMVRQTPGHTGSYCMELSFGSTSSYVYQTLTVSKNMPYQVNFWAANPVGGPATYDLKIGRTVAASDVLSLACSTPGSYSNIISSFVPDTTTVYFTFAKLGSSNIDVDDVYVYSLNVMSDSGSNPIYGVPYNCVLGSTGKIDKACQFTGTASYIIAGDTSTVVAPTVGYITAWVKTTDKTSIYMPVAGQGLLQGANASGQGLFILSGTVAWQARVNGSITSTIYVNTPFIADGNWNFIAGGNSGAVATLYVNGMLVGSTLGSSSEYPRANYFAIADNPPTSNYKYNGYIEDVRVYDRALTQQEISAIYERGRGTYSQSLIQSWPTARPPIHHWRLNELTGTVVNDKGSNPAIGSITSCVLNQVGNIGTCMQFTGTASYVSLSNAYSTGAQFSTTSMFFWFKRSGAAPNTYHALLNFINGGTGKGIQLYIMNSTNKFGAFIDTDYVSSAVISDTNWHLYGLVLQDTNLKMYCDGINVNNATVVRDWGAIATPRIGAYGTYYSYGYLEDCRIYDYALSQQEILNIYNNGKGTYL